MPADELPNTAIDQSDPVTNRSYASVSRPEISQPGNVVLAMHDIYKRYGSFRVLDGLSLQVQAGEVYGFLGRNGAGKSTAIRILMGITRPDKGEIELFGRPAKGHFIEARQHIGYVAQEQNFYPWMTPTALQNFVGRLYPRWSRQRYADLLGRFDLPDRRKIGTFSGGMKARLALTVALATQPKLLLLDEPTAGMDPVARREFLNLVHDQALNEGAAIFFSTHLIDDIESVASRIGVIESGRTIYEGGLLPLAESIASYSVPLTADTADRPPPGLESIAHRVLHDDQRNNRRQLIVQFDGAAPANTLTIAPWQQDAMSLEDVFIAVVSANQTTRHDSLPRHD